MHKLRSYVHSNTEVHTSITLHYIACYFITSHSSNQAANADQPAGEFKNAAITNARGQEIMQKLFNLQLIIDLGVLDEEKVAPLDVPWAVTPTATKQSIKTLKSPRVPLSMSRIGYG